MSTMVNSNKKSGSKNGKSEALYIPKKMQARVALGLFWRNSGFGLAHCSSLTVLNSDFGG